MEWLMFLFGIVVLVLGVAVIYNAHQAKQRRDNPDKKKEK